MLILCRGTWHHWLSSCAFLICQNMTRCPTQALNNRPVILFLQIRELYNGGNFWRLFSPLYDLASRRQPSFDRCAGAAVVIMEKSKTLLFSCSSCSVLSLAVWLFLKCFSYYVSVSVTFSLSVQLHLLLQTKTLATALGSLLAQLTCALELWSHIIGRLKIQFEGGERWASVGPACFNHLSFGRDCTVKFTISIWCQVCTFHWGSACLWRHSSYHRRPVVLLWIFDDRKK